MYEARATQRKLLSSRHQTIHHWREISSRFRRTPRRR